jgi:hypothetical protein
MPCEVVFHIMVPILLEACPYMLFTSHGIHSHPPPPPNNAPQAIMNGVMQLVKEMRDPSLTLGKNYFLSTY